jgi:L-ribulose-5-phosphate 4-epimerase
MARLAECLSFAILAAAGCYGQALAKNATSSPPSDAEILKMKEKLALATRMMTREGIIASSGHLSMRIPGTDHVIVGPNDVSRGIVGVDDIVMVDLNDKQLEGKRKQPSETEIHTGIYRARPDVMAIVHSHPTYSVVLTIIGKPLLPVNMHGAIFADGVPVYDSVGHVDTRERGDGLAQALGNHRAVLIKMHGAAIVGSSLEEAFVAALQLEENAQQQILAESAGKVVPMTVDDAQRSVRESFGPSSIQKRWQYYLDKDASASKPQ